LVDELANQSNQKVNSTTIEIPGIPL